jgi:hypothetical protein
MVVAAALLLLLPQAQDYVQHFIEGLRLQDLATLMRLGEYKDALILISRHPWIGVGFVGTPEGSLYIGVSNVYLLMAEEMGLIGSRYYVEHPLYPLEKTVVYLNVDMVGTGDSDLLIGGMTEFAELFDIVKRGLDEEILKKLRPRPNYRGSDHTSFWGKNVPAISLRTGEVLTERLDDEHPEYHCPGDRPELIDPALLGLACLLAVPLGAADTPDKAAPPPPADAGARLTVRLAPADAVLFKGSRGMRLEEVADAVAAWAWARREWRDQALRFEKEGISPMMISVYTRFYDEADAGMRSVDAVRAGLTYENLPDRFKSMARPQIK